MNYLNKDKKKCKLCSKKAQSGSLFCSEECEELHYEYVSMDIPKLWVKKTLNRMNCLERYNEVKKFSNRHNLKEFLVIMKLERYFHIEVCKGKHEIFAYKTS